ncbi:hypothetical protein C7S13_5894 [Burkholderia cepacia]|nr:hypothetical protein [Burkholderia cepacia]
MMRDTHAPYFPSIAHRGRRTQSAFSLLPQRHFNARNIARGFADTTSYQTRYCMNVMQYPLPQSTVIVSWSRANTRIA